METKNLVHENSNKQENEVSTFYKIEIISSQSVVGSTVKVWHLANAACQAKRNKKKKIITSGENYFYMAIVALMDTQVNHVQST